MKKISLRLFVFIVVFSILSSPAVAAVWIGGGADTLASTASNWTGNTLPPFGDDILFDNTSTKNCAWDLNEGISSLTINGDYVGTVTVTSHLIITNNFAGKWNIFITDNNENGGFEQGPFTVTFAQTGNNIFVAPGSDGDLTATFSGLNITMTNLDSGGVTTTYLGTISPDGKTMSGPESTSDGHHSGTWHGARTFAQADLTGTWDLIAFNAGQETGWIHGVITVNSAGSGTFTDFLDSTGSTDMGTPGCLTWSISETGSVTIGGACGDDTTPMAMSPDKGMIVGTGTYSANTAQLLVLRKRVDGVTYSSADINNSQFAFHALLANGASPVAWAYGAGQTDVSGILTFTSANLPSGPVSPPDLGPLQINSNGIITSASNNTFYGIMTADKQVIFEIDTVTSPPAYRLAAFLKTGQTFTSADLAGTYNLYNLIDGGAAAAWQTGTFVVNSSGAQVFQTFLDSTGGTTVPPGPFALSINSGGQMTSGNASYHGQMSFSKDLYVRTQTQGGPYSLAIGFKK